MRRNIRLSENALNRMISESVRRVINEEMGIEEPNSNPDLGEVGEDRYAEEENLRNSEELNRDDVERLQELVDDLNDELQSGKWFEPSEDENLVDEM